MRAVSTLEDLKALADRKRALIEQLREAFRLRIESEERELAALEAAAATLEKGDLTIDRTERTIRTMDVNTGSTDARVKSGAGRATRKHPAQKKLYQQGKTITSLAAELKEGRPRVSAWFAKGDANRPIPKHHADHLREKYGIPLNAWDRVAD